MRIAILAIGLAALMGCAKVHTRREILDDKGKSVGTVEVEHSATTAAGAAQLLNATRQYEESARGGDLAQQGIAKGVPVSLQTRGASVGVGGYGYNGYGYSSRFGGGNDALAEAEQMGFESRRHVRLPPLQSQGSVPSTVAPSGTTVVVPDYEPCPPDREPVTPGERLTCTELETRARTLEDWSN